MIYTVTFNPSLDYIVSVRGFQLGRTNRTCSEQLVAGGKGINVSIVLKNLGFESVALGFVAGFTGEEIAKQVTKMGIENGFIPVDGVSRINVKLTSVDGTEINGQGPKIDAAKVQELMERLNLLGEGDILFLSGSVPSSVPSDIYEKIMENLKDRGGLVVVDATGELLLQTLPYHPFLVKPNQQELEALFDVTISSRDEVVPYARKLQEMGARNVLVSMGGQGAVLLSENGEIYSAPAPNGNVINSVGAGDSMVAGFMAGWLEEAKYDHAFRMGVAAGSASAFSDKLATKEEIMKLYE